MAQLRHPPGGRDARIMLGAQFVDRAGTGVWAASSVLYFAFVARLNAGQIGLMLGIAGMAGIVGSPLAGRLAGRFPLRSLLAGCHLMRLGVLCLLPLSGAFAVLLPAVAVMYVGDGAAKMLEMLFATEVAGERRSTFRALSRSAVNAAYALGAGIAAMGLAVGTAGAYRALIGVNALSFLVAAAMVWRTREPLGAARSASRPARTTAMVPRSPWRDRGYLLFVLLDTPMNLDDSILKVGLPLWLVNRTAAPHALVPAFLVINTVLVVALQMRVSARTEGPRRAARVLTLYGLTLLTSCAVMAAVVGAGPWAASAGLLAAAALITLGELARSVSSWELAVSLAPREARAAYLGVAGMAQSVQRSAGPPLLTGAVLPLGPVGWLSLGAVVTGLSLVQRRACERRLNALRLCGPGEPSQKPAVGISA
ncbi:MFS transporter [Actinoallomurus sp. NBC_01490]|uniref:MFS transporter n=1 Tax=Actinoallomurus sp. NBC_01490 TaxID=2903557 RepID=UPI002E32B976|nr:MFS transporter [Actinoallomurus sp. NBC_01490]